MATIKGRSKRRGHLPLMADPRHKIGTDFKGSVPNPQMGEDAKRRKSPVIAGSNSTGNVGKVMKVKPPAWKRKNKKGRGGTIIGGSN